MKKKELLDNMLETKNGLLMTSEVIKKGVSKTYLLEYVKRMQLERVSQGVYLSKNALADYFYLLQIRYPKMIFSHETAAYFWDMTERKPPGYTVTVKNGYHAGSMAEQNIKAYSVRKELFELGKIEKETSMEHKVHVYDRERTVCDLVRSRSNVKKQDLHYAIKEYVRSEEKDISKLMSYARHFRVDKVLDGYLELLL